MALTTLQDIADALNALTPQERRFPAMYITDIAAGHVNGLKRLENPVLLAKDAETFSVELPLGMPAFDVEITDFRPPLEGPEPTLRLPEQYRVTPATLRPGGLHHHLARTRAEQYAWFEHESPNGGMFMLPREGRTTGTYYLVLADNGQGNQRAAATQWEHVSVSVLNNPDKRTPTWAEMCYVKNLFWPKDACVLQFHPPEAAYVNFQPYVLHLWRSLLMGTPVPPHALVGPLKG